MTKYDIYFKERRNELFDEFIKNIENKIRTNSKDRQRGFNKLLKDFEAGENAFDNIFVDDSIKTDFFKSMILSKFYQLELDYENPFEHFFNGKFEKIIKEGERYLDLYKNGHERKPFDLEYFKRKDKKEIALNLAEHYAIKDFIKYLKNNELSIIYPESDFQSLNSTELSLENLKYKLNLLFSELKLSNITDELISFIENKRTLQKIYWEAATWKLVLIINVLINANKISLLKGETNAMYIHTNFRFENPNFELFRIEASLNEAQLKNKKFNEFSSKIDEILGEII